MLYLNDITIANLKRQRHTSIKYLDFVGFVASYCACYRVNCM